MNTKTYSSFVQRLLLVAFFAIAGVMGFWVLWQGLEIRSLSKTIQDQLRKNSELAPIAEQVIQLKEQRDKLVDERYQTTNEIQYACSLANSTEEFPIRSGEFITLNSKMRADGFDINFYVPKGEHDFGLMMFSEKQNSNEWVNFRDKGDFEFTLPPESVGRFEFRLHEDEPDNTYATATLFSESGEKLTVKKVPLEMRRLVRTPPSDTSSRSIGRLPLLPGEVDLSTGTSYPDTYITFSFDQIELYVFASIESRKAQMFIPPLDAISVFEEWDFGAAYPVKDLCRWNDAKDKLLFTNKGLNRYVRKATRLSGVVDEPKDSVEE